MLPDKSTKATEVNTPGINGETYYNIDNVFNSDGSYKYEFALRTPYNKLQNGKWATFWGEQENFEQKVRLDKKHSTCFRRSKIPVYMKQSEFESKFGVELTEAERSTPKYLRAFYVEGHDECIKGIFDVKGLLLSPRISAIMKRHHYSEWTDIEKSLLNEIDDAKPIVEKD